jgi:hypothetical protein
MRKLKLEIADLEVTSFAVAAEGDRARGTVAARLQQQVGTQHNGATCDLGETCYGETCSPTNFPNSCLGACG